MRPSEIYLSDVMEVANLTGMQKCFLVLLAMHSDGLSTSQAGKAAGICRRSVQRCMDSLIDEGFVDKDMTAGHASIYALSAKAWDTFGDQKTELSDRHHVEMDKSTQ